MWPKNPFGGEAARLPGGLYDAWTDSIPDEPGAAPVVRRNDTAPLPGEPFSAATNTQSVPPPALNAEVDVRKEGALDSKGAMATWPGPPLALAPEDPPSPMPLLEIQPHPETDSVLDRMQYRRPVGPVPAGPQQTHRVVQASPSPRNDTPPPLPSMMVSAVDPVLPPVRPTDTATTRRVQASPAPPPSSKGTPTPTTRKQDKKGLSWGMILLLAMAASALLVVAIFFLWPRAEPPPSPAVAETPSVRTLAPASSNLVTSAPSASVTPEPTAPSVSPNEQSLPPTSKSAKPDAPLSPRPAKPKTPAPPDPSIPTLKIER